MRVNRSRLVTEEAVVNHNMLGDHAVVLGGSMAGLLAARVLVDAYNRVTVVERDELCESVAPRRGVPQGRHIHALIARGGQILDELFPGFISSLTASGVPTMDQLADARLHFSGHRLRQGKSGVVVLSASRPCLEAHVRERVRALPGVSFADRRDIVGLTTTPNRARVIGARLVRRSDGGTEETVAADLVVDAMGRGSRLPLWLEDFGYGRPAEDKVRIGVGYATGMFRLRPGALGHDQAVIVAPTPAHPRGAGLAIVEGQRHVVTLMGILGDRPPTDLAGFLDFAKSLHVSDVFDAIVDAEPLDDIVGFSFPASVRRRYERMARFPDDLLVVGDGICSLNPIYGQGMSVAAVEAITLRKHLDRGCEARPRTVLRDMAKVVDAPWDMATGADLAFPGVEGPPVGQGPDGQRLHPAPARRGRGQLRARGRVPPGGRPDQGPRGAVPPPCRRGSAEKFTAKVGNVTRGRMNLPRRAFRRMLPAPGGIDRRLGAPPDAQEDPGKEAVLAVGCGLASEPPDDRLRSDRRWASETPMTTTPNPTRNACRTFALNLPHGESIYYAM
jgi:2-polyprenyl-6-methoxyphenol hydroxylase-like FAD-dependent oxidoreductase